MRQESRAWKPKYFNKYDKLKASSHSLTMVLQVWCSDLDPVPRRVGWQVSADVQRACLSSDVILRMAKSLPIENAGTPLIRHLCEQILEVIYALGRESFQEKEVGSRGKPKYSAVIEILRLMTLRSMSVQDT
jgi:hypothetical protein